MTRGQMILDDNSNDFRCFLGRINIDDLAEMLTSVSCEKCMCKSFCENNSVGISCQDTMKKWLNEEE